MKFSAFVQVWLLGATCHGFHILSSDSSTEHHTNPDDFRAFSPHTEFPRPNYSNSRDTPNFPADQSASFSPENDPTEILQRERRDGVDRVLSIFGGALHPFRQPRRHHRPSKWRPIRPHLGAVKHHRHPGPPPPHNRYPPHKQFRAPKPHHGSFHPKQHGPPKHFPHHNDHHSEHHHFEHHDEIIHHNGGDVFHDDDIHHGGNIHHDDEIISGGGQLHFGPVDYVYDDHSLNDIHESDFVVEVNDHKPHLEHDYQFRPSPIDHHDHQFKPIIMDDHEDQSELLHEFGHLSGIAENNIYRDDIPFKEVHNEKDKIHDGLQPGGVKGLDPSLITFISDKSRPYVMGLL